MQRSGREFAADVSDEPQAGALMLLRLLGPPEPGVGRRIPVVLKGREDPADVGPAVAVGRLAERPVHGPNEALADQVQLAAVDPKARDEIVQNGRGGGAGRVTRRVGVLQQVDLGPGQERILGDRSCQPIELLPGSGQPELGRFGNVVDQADVFDKSSRRSSGPKLLSPGSSLGSTSASMSAGRCCRPVLARRIRGEQAERVDAPDLPAEELAKKLKACGNRSCRGPG